MTARPAHPVPLLSSDPLLWSPGEAGLKVDAEAGEAFDSMLNRDARFWEEIAARKVRLPRQARAALEEACRRGDVYVRPRGGTAVYGTPGSESFRWSWNRRRAQLGGAQAPVLDIRGMSVPRA